MPAKHSKGIKAKHKKSTPAVLLLSTEPKANFLSSLPAGQGHSPRRAACDRSWHVARIEIAHHLAVTGCLLTSIGFCMFLQCRRFFRAEIQMSGSLLGAVGVKALKASSLEGSLSRRANKRFWPQLAAGLSCLARTCRTRLSHSSTRDPAL